MSLEERSRVLAKRDTDADALVDIHIWQGASTSDVREIQHTRFLRAVVPIAVVSRTRRANVDRDGCRVRALLVRTRVGAAGPAPQTPPPAH